ncbi:hypothetical protein DEU56DRAFT_817592 [Suillus clintonianus]|uniref:uncharacterized protein n=1 Tax=Suillus clintonianus TaxID=1904413 RepID=UPI001B87EF59|nr:uncharacterized protein DEU56DRAFT_817592 [Suillus clintonianus]KAG2129109.1 hypothetical protein DEU56DRAFT_817592 [Suillus clintonianus]
MLRRSSFRTGNRYRVHSSRRRYNRRNTFRWLLSICLENLPKRKWDQVVMFMFIFALFPFLHALLGIGGKVEQHVSRPAKATSGPPDTSQGSDIGEATPLMNQLLASDTHAGYPVGVSEHITHPTRAPIALTPQDAFPDPTSPVSHSETTPTMPSASAFAQTPEPVAPAWLQEDKNGEGMPYDPFYLEFNGVSWSTPTKRSRQPLVQRTRSIRRMQRVTFRRCSECQ